MKEDEGIVLLADISEQDETCILKALEANACDKDIDEALELMHLWKECSLRYRMIRRGDVFLRRDKDGEFELVTKEYAHMEHICSLPESNTQT